MSQGKETTDLQRHVLEMENRGGWDNNQTTSALALKDKKGGQKGHRNPHEAGKSDKEGIQAADNPYHSDQGNQASDSRRGQRQHHKKGGTPPHRVHTTTAKPEEERSRT
jgi:hypothetical protein